MAPLARAVDELNGAGRPLLAAAAVGGAPGAVATEATTAAAPAKAAAAVAPASAREERRIGGRERLCGTLCKPARVDSCDCSELSGSGAAKAIRIASDMLLSFSPVILIPSAPRILRKKESPRADEAGFR